MDVWSFGIALLHLRLGSAPITESKNDIDGALKVLEDFISGKSLLGLEKLDLENDRLLHRLLSTIICIDPQKRPNSSVILRNKYFR